MKKKERQDLGKKHTADDFEVDPHFCAECMNQCNRTGKMKGFYIESVQGNCFVETNVIRVEGKL
jgi:hypothetical protein